MTIFKTEKKHWVNGYQIRGKNFKTLNLSLFNYGVMFSGRILLKAKISFYKLV